MSDLIQVKVGDLYPGHHARPGCNRYFPQLRFDTYEDTMKVLWLEPETPLHEWPIYELWQQLCVHLFGYMPDGSEHPDRGKNYGWQMFGRNFKRIAASFLEHGYKPEKEVGGEKHIRLFINNDGKMCVRNGNKRVAAIRARDGLDAEVQCLVEVRDDGWQRMQDGLRAIHENQNHAYQPIEHPDFQHWKVLQPCVERWKMMVNHLPKPGTVVDIGSNVGWMCRQFTRAGWKATGVERDRRYVTVSHEVGEWCGLDIHHQNKDVKAWLDTSDNEYDVCLMLSVIMHLFGQMGDDTWDVLNRISERCPVMFLDCVWGGYSKVIPFDERSCPNSIMARTKYNVCELLGRTSYENRPFYVFKR